MPKILLNIDTAANARLIAAFLSTVKSVKSVSFDSSVNEKYDWINPSRPATDDEIAQMLKECEKSPLLSSKEAKKFTMKELKEWRAKK